MGIFLKIFALIMGMIMAFFSSGTPKQSYDPETVDINGVTYKNCFIPEYAYMFLKNEAGKTIYEIGSTTEPFYVGKNGQKWYSISDKIILKGADVQSAECIEGTLYYCPESEWDEMKEFYNNVDNWNYYIESYGDTAEIEQDYIDFGLWNKMMRYAHECTETDKPQKLPLRYKNGALVGIEDYNYLHLNLLRINNIGLCGAYSAFFGEGASNLLEYKGEVYKQGIYYEDLYVEVYKFPNDVQDYIRTLTTQYESVIHHVNK